jgi:hypothetical protein
VHLAGIVPTKLHDADVDHLKSMVFAALMCLDNSKLSVDIASLVFRRRSVLFALPAVPAGVRAPFRL